jgi:hypothetical protein
MKQTLRAALVSSLFASSAALAQGVEMNMNIQVDEDGNATSANIQMQGKDENGAAAGVDMRMRGGTRTSTDENGAAAGVDMRVRGGTRTSTSTTTTTTTHTQVKVNGRVQSEEHYTETTESGPARARPVPSRPPPEPAYRDCGTDRDPGCTLSRDGKYAMDRDAWRGFYQSLKSQPNEITREEMTEKMLKRNYLTAAQLGLVLDLFPNEITRLEVAKNAANHVVNPQHALGFSSKWHNSIFAGEYTDLISEQQP